MIELFNAPPVFIEITPGWLQARRENRGLELGLQRAADGRLTADCRKELIAALQKFLGRKSWQPRVRALCGISAHGVALRRIELPAGGDLEGILRLQIEKEFPLPPDELAWGWREIANGLAGRRALIAAVRREVVEDYAGVLSAAGASPEFTVSAFARELLCPSPGEPHAIVDVGRGSAELASFENGVATAVKILPANGNLARAVLENAGGKTLYVAEKTPTPNRLWEELSARAGCLRLEIPAGDGATAATLGLHKSVSENVPLPRLQAKPLSARGSFSLSRVDFAPPENRRWLARAAALLVVLLLLPYAEALLLKPVVGWQLAKVKQRSQAFTSVAEPELHFLQSLRQSQPPYLDAIYLFSDAASPGTHLDSLSLNQRGEIQLKATMANAQQVTDFRTKLIASGFFADVAVEEQAPVQGQPKVSVRMAAQWKAAAARPALKVAPAPDAAAKTNSAAAAPTSAAAAHKTNSAATAPTPPEAAKTPKT
ncbi:MAG: hypothetical protein ABSE16_11695 [Verrucomicrobiota bacterium]|jgi:hypothetical protein